MHIKNFSAFSRGDETLPRMKRPAALVMTALSALLAVMASTTSSTLLRLLLIAASASAFASTLFMYRRAFPFAAPLIAAAVSFALTRDVTLSAASFLLPLVSGAAIAFSLLKKYDKARTVAFSSAALAAAALLLLPIYFLSGGRVVSYNDILTSLTDLFSSLRTPAGTEFFTVDQSQGVARYVLLVMPAFAMIAVSAVSFLAASLSLVLTRVFSFGDCVSPGFRSYTPSVVSAAVYLLSYFVSAALISNTSADVIGYTAENLLIALLPAMMVYGERTLLSFASKHEKRVLYVALSVILFLVSPSLYLMFISFAGAGGRIYRELRPSISSFINKMRGGGDDGDDDDFDDDDF